MKDFYKAGYSRGKREGIVLTIALLVIIGQVLAVIGILLNPLL